MRIPLTALLLALPALLYSQSAAKLEEIINSPKLSLAEASSFVLEAAGIAGDRDAFAFAQEQAWLSSKTAPKDAATLEEISLLMMGAFYLKGGIMYSLLHNGRYAYREMVYQKFIQGYADPAFTVSGERFLRILGRVLDHIEGDGELERTLARNRILDDAASSLRESAANQESLSSGAEDTLDYEGEFELE
jgi:hypothetical protein